MPDTIKPSVMQDFRNELGVTTSPSFFEGKTPLQPVAIIAGNIGFVKPRTSQKLLSYSATAAAGSNYNYQIATVTTKNIYFVGISYSEGNITAGTPLALFDEASGTGYSALPNTTSVYTASPPANGQDAFYPPFPIPIKAGLRIYVQNPVASGVTFVVHYIEEDPYI